MSEINQSLRDQVEALFTGRPPVPASFDDETEVTVTLTKGQALNVRAFIRMDAGQYLDKIEMAESMGVDLSEHADDINESLAKTVALEAVFAAVAPDSDFELVPKREVQDDYALTV
jgi:hypothetical protein